MSEWLLNRLIATGEQAPPQFAFQGTVNWMRALAIIVESDNFTNASLSNFYSNVARRQPNPLSDTYIYENVLLSLHNLTALNSFQDNITDKYDIIRSAIIAWYYTIYNCSSAMLLAQSNSNPDSHSKTARIWHHDIVLQNFVPMPFSVHLNTIVPKNVKQIIETYRNGNINDLNLKPKSEYEAWGCLYSYLKGTAEYEQEKAELQVRSSKDFKNLNVDNFRTKAARLIRDNKLSSCKVNFLTQAFRYRGKANYRDSIYLSYGSTMQTDINQLLTDLLYVGTNFFRMSCFFLNRRIQRGTWDKFISDLDENIKINIDLNLLKI